MNTISFKSKNKLKVGDTLSSDVYDLSGNIILPKKMVLHAEEIDLLNTFDHISLVPVVHNIPTDNMDYKGRNSYINYSKRKLASNMEKTTHDYLDKNEVTINIIASVMKKIIGLISENDNLVYEMGVIKNYSDDMYVHSINSSVLAMLIGIMTGLNESELIKVGTAGLYSNIGKTVLPRAIVNKLSKLTDEEVDRVKMYTTHGYNIIKGCKSIDYEVAEAIYTMREKYDGSGYPRGLKGDEIPKFGQILSISTYLAALLGKTLYKNTLDPYTSSKMMVKEAGLSFNPELVIRTMKILGFYEVGMTVKLKNGEVARVVSRNRFSPKVKIVSSSNIKGLEIDLKASRGIKIKEIKL